METRKNGGGFREVQFRINILLFTSNLFTSLFSRTSKTHTLDEKVGRGPANLRLRFFTLVVSLDWSAVMES